MDGDAGTGVDDGVGHGSGTTTAKTVRVMRADGSVTDSPTIHEALDLLEPGDLIWVDLVDPPVEMLDRAAGELVPGMPLHPLLIEDVYAARRRPKIDRFDDHLFLDLVEVTTERDGEEPEGDRRRRVALPLPGGEHLTFGAASAIVLIDRVITIRGAGTLDQIDRVVGEWRESEPARRDGPGIVVHALLDLVVDSVAAATEVLEEDVDQLGQRVLETGASRTTVQAEAFALRKACTLVRRVAVPTREAVGQVIRRDGHSFFTACVSGANLPYMHDVQDHAVRIAESLDALREELTSALELNMAFRDNELNQVMKKLSAWAAIIAVPTAVTGYFGQNVPYPGFGAGSGYLQSVVVIVLASVALWLLFRRSGWL